jgi:hypothetical protein
MEGSSVEVQNATIAALGSVAQRFQDAAKAKKEDMEICFFYSKKRDGLSQRIRPMLKLPQPEGEHLPQLAIVDVPSQAYYHGPTLSAAPTEAEVSKLVEDFKNGALEKKMFGR